MLKSQLLQNYRDEVSTKISGYFSPALLELYEFFDTVQKELNLQGGAAEIGVHQGKSFIPLVLLKNDEMNLAIDVFEEQQFNIDHSGHGNFEIFKSNLNQYAPNAKVLIVKSDSNFLTSKFIFDFLNKYKRISLFSIDGSHTASATYNDILLAEKLCYYGSLVFLDDYYNQDWPGVHEGLLRYLLFSPVKFRPLLYTTNKMILCSNSMFPLWNDKLCSFLQTYKTWRFKQVELTGWKFYSIMIK